MLALQLYKQPLTVGFQFLRIIPESGQMWRHGGITCRWRMRWEKDRKVEDGEQFREHREQVPSIHVKRLDIPRNPEDCVPRHWTGRLMVGCPDSKNILLSTDIWKVSVARSAAHAGNVRSIMLHLGVKHSQTGLWHLDWANQGGHVRRKAISRWSWDVRYPGSKCIAHHLCCQGASFGKSLVIGTFSQSCTSDQGESTNLPKVDPPWMIMIRAYLIFFKAYWQQPR